MNENKYIIIVDIVAVVSWAYVSGYCCRTWAIRPANLGDMKADKGQFDEVLRRLVSSQPKKTSEIKAEKKEKEKAPKPSQR